MAELKEKRALLLEQQKSDSAASRQVNDAISILNTASPEITEWDESMIRQLVDTVKVLSAERIRVYLRGGMEIEQKLDKERDRYDLCDRRLPWKDLPGMMKSLKSSHKPHF